MIQRVQQEDAHGCGVAVLAMLTNRSYVGAKSILLRDREVVDFTREGISQHSLDQVLAEEGFAVARKYTHLRGTERGQWPVEPFADVHFCMVMSAAGGHFVILLRDGTVLDPYHAGARRLSDYGQVLNIAGVAPVEVQR